MAITNFIPKIWNSQLEWDFTQAATAANLVNRKYEGDATKGNTVQVTSGVPIAIKDYKAGVIEDADGDPIPRTTAADAISDTKQDLLIDQEKSFDFYVDDIDRAQAAGSLESYTESAGLGLAEDADKFIYAMISGAKTHQTASALSDGDGAFTILRNLRKGLNKDKVPLANRYVAVNAEFAAILLSASSKLTAVDTSGSPAALREGVLGRLLGFTIVETENLPVVSKPQALAWYRPTVSYVSQLTETEGMRASDKFADRVRGLHVYGGKVTNVKGIQAWTAS